MENTTIDKLIMENTIDEKLIQPITNGLVQTPDVNLDSNLSIEEATSISKTEFGVEEQQKIFENITRTLKQHTSKKLKTISLKNKKKNKAKNKAQRQSRKSNRKKRK